MRKYLIILMILSVNTLIAQERKEGSFIVMSSHGYMTTDINMQGSGHITTFLYSPTKLWAYGVDVSIFQGSNKGTAQSIFSSSITPSVYLFPINKNKHQVYIGASMGIGYHKITHPKTGQYSPNLNIKNTGVALGANLGYNYEIAKNWMIGARAYYDDNSLSTIMGLVTVGAKF